MGLTAFIRTMLSWANRPDHDGRTEDLGHRSRHMSRWKSLSLVLAGIYTLLSIGLAVYLSAEMKYYSCPHGACGNGTDIPRYMNGPDSIGLNLDWELVAVGTLTALAVLGTWGLGIWGLGTGGLRARDRWRSRRLAILCLATLPVHVLLMLFSLATYFFQITIDYDVLIVGPRRPLALVCFGLLVFQSSLQIGFVLTQIGRWLFTRQWFARGKSPA